MQSRPVKGPVRSRGGGSFGEARWNRRTGGRTGDGASFRAARGHRGGRQVTTLLPDLHEDTHTSIITHTHTVSWQAKYQGIRNTVSAYNPAAEQMSTPTQGQKFNKQNKR